MKIQFVEPPAALRIGGLDGAIRSLERALQQLGNEVVGNEAFQKADIVHFHGLWQPSHSTLSKRLAAEGIPFVVSPHGMLEPWAWRHKWWKKWPYFFLRERAHLQRSRSLLATAPMEEHRLQTMLPRCRVTTLPLGFTGDAQPNYEAARAELGWAPEETVLLFLSRVHEKKGLDLLLHALANSNPPPSTRLAIVGGGDPAYVASLKTLAATLRLPRVDWLGEIWGEARWKYFQGADLFCLPSHSENFGLAVLEAFQIGTPALTTTTTPWAEAGAERVFLAEPTISSVTQVLGNFFAVGRKTSAERDAIAAWAEANYAWASIAPRYAAFYRELI
jgi:glycosyltransferase involved in cell wall biosynthesis